MVTADELRYLIADIMTSWVGGTRGGAQHKEIISLYNSVLPHPRGYAAQVSDDYCAETVCAAAVKAGIAKYIPFECSCGEIINIARSMGIWIEDDVYVPKVGDWRIFAWDDGSDYANTDNKTGHNHIGVVTYVAGDYYITTEGNMSGRIGTRQCRVNDRYTRGFVRIPYEQIAAGLGKDDGPDPDYEERIHKVEDAPKWARSELQKLIDRGALKGGTDGDLDLTLDMLRVLIICQRMIDE